MWRCDVGRRMNVLDGRFAKDQLLGQRKRQEDNYYPKDERDLGLDDGEHALLLVADGMGGHVGGAEASDLLCKTFVKEYKEYPRASGSIVDRLHHCLRKANAAIAAEVAKNPALASMGSTLVAAVVSSEGLNWISVGDSPLWLFHEGQLKRLNADHSMASELDELVAEGRMTAEEAEQDPRRNMLNSAVMGDRIEMINESGQPVAVEKGDLVVLASDGLLTLDKPKIARILQEKQDAPLEDSVKALIQAVEAAGHPYQDNVTVLLYAPQADGDSD